MNVPARRLVPLLVALLVAGAGPVFAGPDVVIDLGGTYAVTGVPNDGGISAALSVLLPIEPRIAGTERLRFGLMLMADDFGTRIGRLRDPNDGSDLGPAEETHRDTWGGAWRLDAAWGAWRGWTPVATGSWGAYRIEEDHRGRPARGLTSTGFGLGLGIERSFSDRHAAGATVRYHRLFNDVTGRYMSAGVAMRWTPWR